MSKDLRTPKYLREFVLSRCLCCTVRVEAIAREWTKQLRGPMPGFGTKELPDYAKGAASDFKQVQRAVLDLVELKKRLSSTKVSFVPPLKPPNRKGFRCSCTKSNTTGKFTNSPRLFQL